MKVNFNIVVTALLFIIFALSCKQKKAENNSMSQMEEFAKVKLNKAQMQLANLVVEDVKEDSISNEIILSGRLVVNEEINKAISSKVSGRIDKLYHKSQGEIIYKGDILYEIYSTELQSAQKEYLLALAKQKKLGSPGNDFSLIIEATETRLFLFGMSSAQIENLKRTGSVKSIVPVYSTESGYIKEIKINEGDYVSVGSTVFILSDNSRLWLEAQTYSDETEYIKDHTTVTYTISAFPDEELSGTITFINPVLEKNSTVNLIRVEIPNESNKYKPGLMAEIKLKINEKRAILVPVDAVLENSNGSTVWIQNTDSTFEVRMVVTGIRNSDKVEIVSGLNKKERVVVSGAFLLNSEYILKNGSDPMAGMKM